MGPALSILAVSAGGSVVLLGAAALAAALARSQPAATRHLVWTVGVGAALAVPGLAALADRVPSAPVVLAIPVGLGAVGAGSIPGDHALPGLDATGWLGALWAVGTVLTTARLVRDHLAAAWLVRAADPTPVAAWSAPLAAARSKLGMSGAVELRASAHLGSPVTVGLLRPRILLPRAATAWPADRLYPVLLHELAHVRRRDGAVQLLAGLAVAAYWWNPLAWLAARRLRAEREDACDDLVLAAGVRPSTYAGELLALARTLSAAPLRAAVPAVRRSGVELRLRRILDPAVPRGLPSAVTRRTLVAGAAALALLAACVRLPAPGPDDALAAAIRPGLGDIDTCFAAAPAGHVTMHWTVDALGTTVEACVTEDTIGDDAVRACVNEHLAVGYFPALADRSVEVRFPLGDG